MTAVPETVDYAHTQGAEQNRILKARKIARWLWDRDLHMPDVLAADEPTRRAWARAALVSPPSTMDTWRAVNDALNAMERFAEDNPGHPATVRAHASERPDWVRVVETPEPPVEAVHVAPVVALPVPACVRCGHDRDAHGGDKDCVCGECMWFDTARGDVPPPVVVEPAQPVVVPRGWVERVAFGPIPRKDARCRTCGAPAVAATVARDREEWRCANHPPQPGEWGALLDWTPPDMAEHARWCPPGRRCYEARCPNFRLGARAPMSDSALHDERSAAKGKNRAPFHVRRAAADAENARKDAEKARRGAQ